MEVKKLGIVEHRNHNNKNENPNENKESELKIVTVYVTVKGVKACVVMASKETMSCSASKATNKKGNNLAKKETRQHQMIL